jgi:hypothetical protein
MNVFQKAPTPFYIGVVRWLGFAAMVLLVMSAASEGFGW